MNWGIATSGFCALLKEPLLFHTGLKSLSSIQILVQCFVSNNFLPSAATSKVALLPVWTTKHYNNYFDGYRCNRNIDSSLITGLIFGKIKICSHESWERLQCKNSLKSQDGEYHKQQYLLPSLQCTFISDGVSRCLISVS